MKNLEVRLLIIIPAVLLFLGLVELSSISKVYFERELAWALLSLGIFVAFTLIPLKFWRALALPIYIASLLLLVLTLFKGGPGPRRWLTFGGMRFQPSELAKLAYILMAAKIIAGRRRGQFPLILQLGTLAVLPFMLTVIEPDLATSVTFLWIYISLLYLFEVSSRYLLFLILPPLAVITSFSPVLFLILFVGAFLYSRYIKSSIAYSISLLGLLLTIGLTTPIIWNKALKDYQRQRVIAFLAPEKYKTGAGWQVVQAKIALGSGGLLGKGYGKGTQKGLAFLPAAHTDFIFSSFGEEFGFLGSLIVFALVAVFLVVVMNAASKMRDRYRRALGFGILAYFVYHFLANIGTNLGLFPVAGVPLPFMTYGGSHLIVEMSFLGLLIRSLKEEKESYRFLL